VYPFSIFVGLALLRPLKNLFASKFLETLLNSPLMQRQFDQLSPGSTRRTLALNGLKSAQIPVPPLTEQERIVNRAESLLARTEDITSHLSRVPVILKRFRQAVLTAACSGKLTAEWREAGHAAEDVRSLLEHILRIRQLHGSARTRSRSYQLRSDLPDIPSTWVWIPFGDLIASLRSGSTEPPLNEETPYPILRSSSVRPGVVHLNDVRYLTDRQSQNADNFIARNDMLFTRLSGSIEFVANCAVVPELNGKQIQYPDRLFCGRLLEPQCVSFCELCFACPSLRDFLTIESKSSAGHQRISMSAITDMPIPLPPLAEQREIVRVVDSLFTLADVIEEHASTATSLSDKLTQSILAKAFRGELVPTEAELARREGREYEPASKLLERVRKEHESNASSKPERKRRRTKSKVTA
jgi:type I restriction enzyme S subunit